MKRLAVDLAPGEYTIARLPKGAPTPTIDVPGLVSITTTADGLSVICPSPAAPESEDTRPGWRLLTVRGPLEFDLTGVMAALAGELAAAGVTLLAMSTYDTDHVLIPTADLDRAIKALREAGHDVGPI